MDFKAKKVKNLMMRFFWDTLYIHIYMTSHLLAFHKGEDPQKFVQIQILQSAPDLETAKKLEKEWTMKLFCFLPTGLNLREEYQDLL